MPIHDWTKVIAGIFHDFHAAWIIELRNALNAGALPPGYYALAEQVTKPYGPDVLTLQASNGESSPVTGGKGSIAILDARPKVRIIQKSEIDIYAKKANHVTIRHTSDDHVVAIIEILSPGNKNSRHAIDEFLDKVYSVLEERIHLMLIDLFPPTSRDPQGIHALIWGDAAQVPPPELPLTLASYNAVPPMEAYVEPTAVNATLIDMPLFLDAQHYIPVPLETTYNAAWRGVPDRWKSVLSPE